MFNKNCKQIINSKQTNKMFVLLFFIINGLICCVCDLHWLFIAFVTHELGHYLAAYILNQKLCWQKFSLSLPAAISKKQEAQIAFAGPFNNIIFGLIFLIFANNEAAFWQLLLAQINLIPAMPNDGGRLLLYLSCHDKNIGQYYYQAKILCYISYAITSIFLILLAIAKLYQLILLPIMQIYQTMRYRQMIPFLFWRDIYGCDQENKDHFQ